ncbi:MAG: OmpH family outer membrane protein [Halanaerobiales bacterium]
MKKVSLLIIATITLLLLAGCSTPQPDQVAYLNMEEVVDDSQRAQEITKELADIGDELEIRYQETREEIAEGEEDEETEEQLDSLSREYLDHKRRLEGVLNQEINEIIAEIAERDNISTVLYSESVYFGGVDISQEVIERLDERYNEGGES